MSTRITDLPQATELNGSEIMPLVQNGVTKKATLDFINLAAPAALILQQTQQVYQDTVDVKAATDAVLVETQSVLGDTQVVLGQTIGVRNETQTLKLDFETQYLGPHASPPTLDNEGNPLENGALYWDTTLMAMFVWSGVSWTAFSSAVASVNGYIGEVILNFQDVGAAGPGANSNITSLSGLTGDIETATGLQFDTAAPSAAGVGKLTWNTTDQTLDLGLSAGGVSMQIGQEVYYRVKNGTAGVIPNGSMVRYTGTEGLAGNILVAPALANGSVASQTFLGLTTETLNPGDSGFATHFGRVRGIDTTGNPYGEVWADGDVIFASALVAGWLTKNPPEAPNNRVRVGIVVHAHPNGVLFVNPTYGGKLSENEQVQLASLADGDVLKYVAANGRFENMSFATAGIETLGAAAASMAAHLADLDPHPQYTTTAEASAAAPVQSVAGKTGAVSLTNADVGLGNVANVLQAAAARLLTAGNGLTGGGDLSADRTLTLGTPSTLTTGTTNAVTATSHTHAVTFPVTSVAGKTGAVALVKADVGLDQVDNTSDADKPVSTATAAALNLKVSKDSDTGAASLPVGTTAQRPVGAVGKLRFNSTLSQFEGHNGSDWGPVGGGAQGYRNKIINGKMEIAQRGTSFAAIVSGGYSLDRWQWLNSSGAVATASQQSDVPSGDELQSSLRFAVTTADTSIGSTEVAWIRQVIEGFNVRDLIGRTFTLSFRVRSSKTGAHCVVFSNGVADRSFIAEYTVNAANTWERKSVTVTGGLITAGTWDWTNGAGLSVGFTLAAGSSRQGTAGSWLSNNAIATVNQVNCLDTVGNIFAITGVQLEVGPVATPFEHRPYGVELTLCQRYYERHPGATGAFPQSNALYARFRGNNQPVDGMVYFSTTKRSYPTVTARFDINDGAEANATFTVISPGGFCVTLGTVLGAADINDWQASSEL